MDFWSYRSRRFTWLPIALLLALLPALAACGSEQQAQGQGPTRTVTDAVGKQVTVPTRPQRVLALSEPTLDATLALGIEPVGTTAGRGQTAVPAYLRERAGSVPSIGTLGAPNLEKVVNTKPDIILIDGTAKQDPAVIDKLEKIAPTVLVSKDSTDWKGAFKNTARILDRQREGDRLVDAYERRVKTVRAALGGHASDTVSIVRWSGIGLPAVLMREVCAGRVLGDIGLKRPKFQDQEGPGHSVPVSLESLGDLDGDWIFFGALGAGAVGRTADIPADVRSARAAIATARKTPGFQRLRAFRAGRVVAVDGSAWSSAGGLLAAGIVLDDVERTLRT